MKRARKIVISIVVIRFFGRESICANMRATMTSSMRKTGRMYLSPIFVPLVIMMTNRIANMRNIMRCSFFLNDFQMNGMDMRASMCSGVEKKMSDLM